MDSSRALSTAAAIEAAAFLKMSPSVRPLGRSAAFEFNDRGTTSRQRRPDVRALLCRALIAKLIQRRVQLAFSQWRSRALAQALGAERKKLAAFQQLMENRSKRICVRYGRDKLRALLQIRQRLNVRVAFEQWRSAAVFEHARAVLSRSRLQVQVALDQARAERGVYERAELQAARDKRITMLMYAFMRWRDISHLATASAALAASATAANSLVERANHLAHVLNSDDSVFKQTDAALAARGTECVSKLLQTLGFA